MRRRIFSQIPIAGVIWDQLPRSVVLRWGGYLVAIVHYLARGEEMFCCVKDRWWKIEYRWAEYNRGEEGIEYYPEIDQVTEVTAPEGVTYSHSIVLGLEEGDKLTDGCLIGGEMGYDLCLDSYPPYREHS